MERLERDCNLSNLYPFFVVESVGWGEQNYFPGFKAGKIFIGLKVSYRIFDVEVSLDLFN